MRVTTNPGEFQPTQNIKFTKTETEYNMKSIRFLLLTITTMFLLIGALMIVIGISVYSHYHSLSFFYESVRSGRFFAPSIMSVIIGMSLLVVTSVGFCGSLKKSTCMVNMYAVLLTIILIVKLVLVIMAFTLNGDTLSSYLNIPVWEYAKDPEIQDEIDALQVSLNCCGSDSYMDYEKYEVNFTETQNILSYRPSNGSWIDLPITCCISGEGDICTRIRHNGCKENLISTIVQNSSILGVLGVSVMFIQLLGVIFSLLLARCIRKMKSEKALLTWKIKEQMIIARQEARRKENVYIDQPDSSVA